MKKILIAAAVLAVLTTGANAQTVRIGTEGAYAPWNFVDESGKLAGFEIDLGAELCSRAGLECEFVANEWDSIIPNLVAGNYDAIMAGMSVTEGRMESIDFSGEYYPPDASVYAMAAGAEIDFDNMSGVRIGVQGATIQADWVAENLADNNTIVSYETADQSTADLAAGNVDVVLADGSFLGPVVAGSNGALVIGGPEVAIGGGVAVGLRKDADELEAKFNEAIASMKADGSLVELIVKWFDEPVAF
jgi:polar amino acid transport system substrate-binding protein